MSRCVLLLTGWSLLASCSVAGSTGLGASDDGGTRSGTPSEGGSTASADDTGSGGNDTGSGGDDTGSGGDDTGSGGNDTGSGGNDTGSGEPVPDGPVGPGEAPGAGGASPGPSGSERCAPLAAPVGNVVSVTPDDDLAERIRSAEEGTTLLLADGVYDVSQAEYIAFATPGVTLRSASGDPTGVIIDGNYEIGSIFNVVADAITIAEVTLQRCQWHPIHVTGSADGDTNDTFIYRVRVLDPGQQAIKINANEGHYADGGTIACSTIALSDEGRGHVSDCYTGGVDAHLARDWQVRDNHISGFYCAEGLSEHAIHFWNSGRDTVVERNVIQDCARGVGFGLGSEGNGTARAYEDDPCPGASFVGHYGGLIRNNFIAGTAPALFASAAGFDSGISLEQACGATVVHNTVYASETPFTSIEYRFENTDVFIANNLTSHQIMERDGANATLDGNLGDAAAEFFVDAASGDLHLVADAPALGQGAALPDGFADEDFDGESRGAAPDVGADER